jgi:hypothetical protein
MTLSDNHLVLLSAAAQRDDRLLTPPPSLKGHPRQALERKLLRLNLVELARGHRDRPSWGEDDQGAYGLRISSAGLAEIGIEVEEGLQAAPVARTDKSARADEGAQTMETRDGMKPRTGSKIAQVVAMLERPDGATIEEIEMTTGWLPHTIRAALTGLRKKGLSIDRLVRSDGASAYGIARTSHSSLSHATCDEAR